MEAAVFLDRDNTLIRNDGDLGDPARVELIDGVAEGLRTLRDRGYRLIVVTNQGGVARGQFTESDVDAVHQRIAELISHSTETDGLVDRFYYCPFHPDGELEDYRRDHPWRKPHPGMLLQAARDLNLDLTQCWMIGDQDRDMLAGQHAGCRTVLVQPSVNGSLQSRPTAIVSKFSEAVERILSDGTVQQAAATAPPAPADKTDNQPVLPPPAAESTAPDQLEALRRAVLDLTEEIRSNRQRQAEFTPLKVAAVFVQLLVFLLAVLGLLRLDESGIFTRWMVGAGLSQLLVIALLLMDSRG